MTPAGVDDFQREVARVALTVASRYGFVLGGGVAWVLHGLVDRPTEDVDLFANVDGAAAAAVEEIRQALASAGFQVYDEDPEEPGHDEAEPDISDLFSGFDLDMKELFLVRDGREVKLSLSRLDRHDSPVIMDVGPVMSVDDLTGSKVAALINRREPRDYIDVSAALDQYTIPQLLDLARRCDPGLDPDDVTQVGCYLDRLPDSRFERYGLGPADMVKLRARLVGWPRA